MSNMKNNLKSNKSYNENVKLNILERTLYKKLYSTLEKSLMACYQIYRDDLVRCQKIKSYNEFITIVDKKLKGE